MTTANFHDDNHPPHTVRPPTLAAMATRLVSTVPTSQPTASSSSGEVDLPQDDLIVEFNAIIWVLVGLSGIFFFLRAYCKITRQRGLWWDDHVMGLAWVSEPLRPIARYRWETPLLE